MFGPFLVHFWSIFGFLVLVLIFSHGPNRLTFYFWVRANRVGFPQVAPGKVAFGFPSEWELFQESQHGNSLESHPEKGQKHGASWPEWVFLNIGLPFLAGFEGKPNATPTGSRI